jgi:glycogen operon protein
MLTAIMQDPTLQRLKLIAEPWDLAGTAVGRFVPGWTEWNDRSRDELRRFCLARDVGPGALADRLAGSSDFFRHAGRVPSASLNFVVCHDGFTLDDLVTYSVKRNEANGEAGRDGNDNNHGWNAGVEGPTDDPAVVIRRQRLKRLLLAALLVSRGVPMLAMGDEIGHSQGGNNNGWCQDNETSWLDWSKRDAGLEILVQSLLRLRREHPVLRRPRWLDDEAVEWFSPTGGPLSPENWRDPACRTLGLRWRGYDGEADLIALFNAGPEPVEFALPPGGWTLLIDSAEGLAAALHPFSVRILCAAQA